MGLIQTVVQDAIAAGYLSCEDENQLRRLLQTTKYGRDDVQAFVRLQRAIMLKDVCQQSRLNAERLYSSLDTEESRTARGRSPFASPPSVCSAGVSI